MKKYFVVYAEGETAYQLQEEINKLIDDDFTLHRFPFVHNGKCFQSMTKNIDDSQTSAMKAYQAYMMKKSERPYKAPPPGPDRANG